MADGLLGIQFGMQKTYDRIKWGVLGRIMKYLGFFDHFIALILNVFLL